MSAQAPQERWTLQLDLRGPDALDGRYVEIVGDVLVGRQGEIVIADLGAGHVKVFSRTGAYLRSIGRRGRGPGEFQRPSRLGWLGDTLWVVDAAADAVALFDLGGRFIGTLDALVTPEDNRLRPTTVSALMHDGTALVWPTPYVSDDGRFITGEAPLIRAHIGSNRRSTIATLQVGHPVMILSRGRSVLAYQPFNDGSLWRAAPSGEWFVIVQRPASGSPAEFRVRREANDGRVHYDRRLPYVGIQLTRRAVDSVVGVALQQLGQVGYRHPRIEEEVRAALHVPQRYPPVSGVVAGRDGTVWLRREDTGAPAVRWEVLDEGGTPRAWFEAPSHFRIHQADRQFVWGVSTDSLGVETVERYRVRRSTR